MNTKIRNELLNLIEASLEEDVSADQIARLEQIVLGDSECMSLYLEVMQLHGNLFWDAAGCGSGFEDFVVPASRLRFSSRLLEHRRAGRFFSTVAALLVMVCMVWLLKPNADAPTMATTGGQPSSSVENGTSSTGTSPLDDREPERSGGIVEVHLPQAEPEAQASALASANGTTSADHSVQSSAKSFTFSDSSDQQMVEFINSELLAAWKENEVQPSPRADDAEWVRRVHLDLAGRIPTTFEVESFLNDADADKRNKLLDSLLESRDFASHFGTIWANLLVGRSRERDINRESLFAYLQRQFGNNAPWSETVTDLVAAKGSSDESGPANFLLAHLNNEAVPATAITARIFLCQQIQCSQCHQHPSVPEWGQDRFWEFNAFFQRTSIDETVVTDDETGRKTRVRSLVDLTSEKLEPAFYEDLRGVMKVAFPKFAGTEIELDEKESLRSRLAELMTRGTDLQLAKAFVNRNWRHFFGHAFTRHVDDMGPHYAVSHPDLLEGISQAFVESGYDVRRLVRWICLSDAYHRTSRPIPENELDNPEIGELPLFSRMYIKPLAPEQLFNSLMIATGVSSEELHRRGGSYTMREDWLQQFFTAVENEENGEISTFDGSLPQTLMMMNGQLVQRAIDPQHGEVLKQVVKDRSKSEIQRIQELCLAALSRYPTKAELEAIRKSLRNQVRLRTARNVSPQVAYSEALRDVYWAYLNSSEFSVNH